MDYASALGWKVTACRRRKELTQVELAKESGVSRATIAGIEKGDGNPRLKSLVRLAEVLGVTVPELFEFTVKDARELSPKLKNLHTRLET